MEYIFYEIKCNDSNITDFYIGSTMNFTRRKCQHKHHCNNKLSDASNYKIYNIIRENGGWDNWTMNPIDKQTFETKLDARIHENKIITERQSTLNTHKAVSSNEKLKKYKELNRDKYKEYQKEYNKNYRLKKKLEKENEISSV